VTTSGQEYIVKELLCTLDLVKKDIGHTWSE